MRCFRASNAEASCTFFLKKQKKIIQNNGTLNLFSIHLRLDYLINLSFMVISFYPQDLLGIFYVNQYLPNSAPAALQRPY